MADVLTRRQYLLDAIQTDTDGRRTYHPTTTGEDGRP